MVYDHLVVANKPLLGRSAPVPGREDRKHGLNLAILRVNRQIHDEARAIFYGKNTFAITSASAAKLDEVNCKYEAARLADIRKYSRKVPSVIDPPLPPTAWPFLRKLTIDLLYHPRIGEAYYCECSGQEGSHAGCTAYFSALTSLLTITAPTLLALDLTVNVTHPSLDAQPGRYSHPVRRTMKNLETIILYYITQEVQYKHFQDNSKTRVPDYTVPALTTAIGNVVHLKGKDVMVHYEFSDAYYETRFRGNDSQEMVDELHKMFGKLLETRSQKRMARVLQGAEDDGDKEVKAQRVNLATVAGTDNIKRYW